MELPFLKYIWERQRQSTRGGGAEKERGRPRIRSRTQAPSCQHRAQRGAQTHKPRDHDVSQSWMLNRLSHPGAPGIGPFFKVSSRPMWGWNSTPRPRVTCSTNWARRKPPPFLSLADTQCYIRFRRTVWWFNVSVPYATLAASGATVWHHTAPWQYPWLSPCAVLFIPMTYSFRNQRPVSPTPVHPLCPSLHPGTVLLWFLDHLLLVRTITQLLFVYRSHILWPCWTCLLALTISGLLMYAITYMSDHVTCEKRISILPFQSGRLLFHLLAERPWLQPPIKCWTEMVDKRGSKSLTVIWVPFPTKIWKPCNTSTYPD